MTPYQRGNRDGLLAFAAWAPEMKQVLDENHALRERIAVLEGQLAQLSGACGLIG